MEEQRIAEIVAETMKTQLKDLGLLEIGKRFTLGGDGGTPKPTGETVFKSFGEQLQTVARAGKPGEMVDPKLYAVSKATGMSEGIASDGGFLVQQDFVAELLKRTYEIGQIIPRCRHIPISANSNSVKINYIAETSRATGSRWGGVQGYWLAEAGIKTASFPKLGQLELSLKKLAILAYSTDELLQDAAALQAVIGEAAAEEIAFLTEDTIINGTGVGQPLGILAGPCLVTVAKETNQAAATLVAANVIKMWARLWGRSRLNSVWLINQDIESQLYQLNLPVGTGGQLIYMPPGGLSAVPYATLFGRPVLPVEYCATLGTVGDIILADFSQYLVAEKAGAGIEAEMSIHVKFVYDETAFRFVFRVDGQPAWASVLTPYKGTATLAPFVALATRA